MKSKEEIISEIERLNLQKDKLYGRKKRAKNNSSTMRSIDAQMDKNGARTRALKWVVDV